MNKNAKRASILTNNSLRYFKFVYLASSFETRSQFEVQVGTEVEEDKRARFEIARCVCLSIPSLLHSGLTLPSG